MHTVIIASKYTNIFSQHQDTDAADVMLGHARRLGLEARLVEAPECRPGTGPGSTITSDGLEILAWESDEPARRVRESFSAPAERPWVRVRTSAGISFGSGSASLRLRVFRGEAPVEGRGLTLDEAARRGLIERRASDGASNGFVSWDEAEIRGRVPGVVIRVDERYYPGGATSKIVDLDLGLAVGVDGRPTQAEAV